MEPLGLHRYLDFLKEAGIQTAILTSGRHVTIRKIMRLEYANIIHHFDVWHIVKSVIKKLTSLDKLKSNEALSVWIQSISNHSWWCAESFNGDAMPYKKW